MPVSYPLLMPDAVSSSSWMPVPIYSLRVDASYHLLMPISIISLRLDASSHLFFKVLGCQFPLPRSKGSERCQFPPFPSPGSEVCQFPYRRGFSSFPFFWDLRVNSSHPISLFLQGLKNASSSPLSFPMASEWRHAVPLPNWRPIRFSFPIPSSEICGSWISWIRYRTLYLCR